MNESITIDPYVVIGGLTLIIVALLILQITLWVKVNKLRKRYRQVIRGDSVQNIEQLLIDLNSRLDRMEDEALRHTESAAQIKSAMRRMKAKVGVTRYNAFGERGGDMSFSMAIVDEEQSGLVMTGIHNRDNTYLYVKPMDKGQSKYTLTEEEKEALNRSSGS